MSANQKFTPWFRKGELPVRAGVYQTQARDGRLSGATHWRFFDGQSWHFCVASKEAADAVGVSDLAPDEWRGLAEDPSKVGGA